MVFDFDGLYVVADANVALGSEPGIQTMRNEHAVVINLSSKQQGGELNLGGGCTHHAQRQGRCLS
jgi:hypothetical protein